MSSSPKNVYLIKYITGIKTTCNEILDLLRFKCNEILEVNVGVVPTHPYLQTSRKPIADSNSDVREI